jgi:hypothetical protein
MLPFGVTFPVTVPKWSEIPKRLMNYPVYDNKICSVLHVNYLFYFNKTGIFWTVFRKKNFKITNFIKSVQWEPSYSMRTEGQTDTTKLVISIQNFANESKITGYKIVYLYFRHNSLHYVILRGRLCIYDVTFRHFLSIIVAVEKQ